MMPKFPFVNENLVRSENTSDNSYKPNFKKIFGEDALIVENNDLGHKDISRFTDRSFDTPKFIKEGNFMSFSPSIRNCCKVQQQKNFVRGNFEKKENYKLHGANPRRYNNNFIGGGKEDSEKDRRDSYRIKELQETSVLSNIPDYYKHDKFYEDYSQSTSQGTEVFKRLKSRASDDKKSRCLDNFLDRKNNDSRECSSKDLAVFLAAAKKMNNSLKIDNEVTQIFSEGDTRIIDHPNQHQTFTRSSLEKNSSLKSNPYNNQTGLVENLPQKSSNNSFRANLNLSTDSYNSKGYLHNNSPFSNNAKSGIASLTSTIKKNTEHRNFVNFNNLDSKIICHDNSYDMATNVKCKRQQEALAAYNNFAKNHGCILAPKDSR